MKTVEHECGCVVSSGNYYTLTKMCARHHTEHFEGGSRQADPKNENTDNLDLVS